MKIDVTLQALNVYFYFSDLRKMIGIRVILFMALLFFAMSNSAKIEFDKTFYDFFGLTMERHTVAVQGNILNSTSLWSIIL